MDLAFVDATLGSLRNARIGEPHLHGRCGLSGTDNDDERVRDDDNGTSDASDRATVVPSLNSVKSISLYEDNLEACWAILILWIEVIQRM
jgi:hypothetical protein